MNTRTYTRHQVSVGIFFILVLVLGWFVYQPAMSGPFLLDDFDNLGVLEVGVTDTSSLKHYLETGNAGPLERPISKLSFLLNDNAWPSEPYSFKRTNLLIHLLVAVFLFLFCRLASRTYLSNESADWVAIATTLIWAVHPIQMSTVMYVVQRMTELATLFTVIGVCSYTYFRIRFREPGVYFLAGIGLVIGLFTVLAALSKESGALLPVYILVLESTLFSGYSVNKLFIWWKRVFLVTPTIAIIGYVLYLPRWIGAYQYRDFSILERVLTEPVIIWDYLISIFSLKVHGLSLFHDDYEIYSSFMTPMVLLCIGGITVLLVSAIYFRKRFPVLAFGILWYFTGHILESTTIALELYFEHRNYLALFGPVFAFCYLFYVGLSKVSGSMSRLFIPAISLLIILISSVSWGYANEWSASNRLIPVWAAQHPESPRAQRAFVQFLASEGHSDAALGEVVRLMDRFERDLSLPLIAVGISCAFDLPQVVDLSNVVAQIERYRWTDGLRPASSGVLELMGRGKCLHIAPQLAEVLGATVRWKGQGVRVSGIASLQVIAGDMLKAAGDGSGALNHYKIVDNLKPSSDSAMRIAGLFLEAGQHNMARKALEIAIERDAASGISDEDMGKYKDLFEYIDQRLESSPANDL